MWSVLSDAEHLGERLNDEEIFAFCRLLVPGGAETTYRSSSNLLVGLLSHTAQRDAVRADRSVMPQAIEEGLRWELPLLLILRTAAIDTEVCGVAVPAGSAEITNMGSAKPRRNPMGRAGAVRHFRESKPLAALAYVPHTCLGMHLARMETHTVLTPLLDRLPNLRLDPSSPAPQIRGMTFRSPAAIRVVWDT